PRGEAVKDFTGDGRRGLGRSPGSRLKTWKAALTMMKTWDRVERAIVGALGLAALAIALWQMLSRYFFPHEAISYAEEVMVYLLIWAIMIVSSQLVSTDSHIRPVVLPNS